MEVLYAYCRAVDDVVDQGNLDEPKARAQLALWRRELEACGRGFPTHPIAVALQSVRERFDLPLNDFEKILAGVEMDLRPRRYEAFEELKNYCEHVASAVGRVSVRIFGCRHPARDRYAQALGIAFQLTNILRDVGEDARQGRVYLPQEDLRRFGVTEDELPAPAANDGFRLLMMFECARARGYFKAAGQAARESGEGRFLLPARIMAAVYGEILGEIERHPAEVLSRRISIPKGKQVYLAAKCLLTSSL